MPFKMIRNDITKDMEELLAGLDAYIDAHYVSKEQEEVLLREGQEDGQLREGL